MGTHITSFMITEKYKFCITLPCLETFTLHKVQKGLIWQRGRGQNPPVKCLHLQIIHNLQVLHKNESHPSMLFSEVFLKYQNNWKDNSKTDLRNKLYNVVDIANLVHKSAYTLHIRHHPRVTIVTHRQTITPMNRRTYNYFINQLISEQYPNEPNPIFQLLHNQYDTSHST